MIEKYIGLNNKCFKYLQIISVLLILCTLMLGSRDIVNGVLIDKQIGLSVSLIFSNLVLLVSIYKQNLKVTAVDFFMLLLVAYFFAHYLFFSEGIGSNFYAFVLLLIMYFNLRIIITKNRKVGFYIILFLCLLLILEVVIGFLQLLGVISSFHNLFNVTGTFFNPGPFSNFIAIVFPIQAYYLIPLRRLMKIKYNNRNGIVLKMLFYLLLFAVILSILILPFTMGRSAWIGALMAIIVLIYRETKICKVVTAVYRKRRIFFFLVAVILVVGLYISALFIYNLKSDSAKGRVLIWKLTTEIFADNPFWGVGFDNFKGAYLEKQSNYFEENPNDEISYYAGSPEFAFNDGLQILAEGGIVGGIIVLSICVLVFLVLLKHKNGVLYAAISLLAVSLTSYPLNVLHLGMLAIFIVAYSQSMEKRYVRIKWYYYYPLILVGLMISVNSFLFFIKKRKALEEWTFNKSSYQNKAHRSLVYKYQEIYPNLIDESAFLIEYADCLGKVKRYEDSFELLKKHKNRMNDPFYYVILGENYKGVSDNLMAETNFKKAVYHSPNRIEPLFYMAKFYSDENNFQKSDSIIDVALQMKLKVDTISKKRWHEKLKELSNENHNNCKIDTH